VSAERARLISTVRSNELSSYEIPRTEQVTYEVIQDQLASLYYILRLGVVILCTIIGKCSQMRDPMTSLRMAHRLDHDPKDVIFNTRGVGAAVSYDSFVRVF
jgi:hypothetical protein